MDFCAGWIVVDACLAFAIAAVAGGAPARFRRSTRAVLAAVLLVGAGVLILPAVRDDSRNTPPLRLEETALMKLMDKILLLQDHVKHNQEMISSLFDMLPENPGNSEARSPDGTENPELTVTLKPPGVDQPPVDDDHTDEIMEAPPAAGGSPSPPHGGDATGEHEQKPWRYFSIPQGHVFVLDCADGELTLHVRPPSAAGLNDDDETTRCSSRQEQAYLYDYGSKRTLFVPAPGKERVVPTAWPQPEMYQKLVAAMLKGEESPAVREQAVPESFRLSRDVVLFYQPVEDGMTELLLSAAEVLQYKDASVEELATRAALTPPTTLPTSFP